MYIGPKATAFVESHRVARLATVDAHVAPHVIPICYAFDGHNIYSALDMKSKRVEGMNLKRVRNIASNPHVAFIVDDYSEDWTHLAYVLIQGIAELLESVEIDQHGLVDVDENMIISSLKLIVSSREYQIC